jgi:RNA polymerase sigma-70 factor (ECF subfamily)
MSNATVTSESSAARAPLPDPILDADAFHANVAPPPKSGPTLVARPAAANVKPGDRELVERTLRGEQRAFGELVRRHQRRIYRLTLHMLRDRAEAEDVTQETFVRAYGALARFDGRSEPYTWIYRIAVNLSLNAIRARRSARRTIARQEEETRYLSMENDATLRSCSPPVDAAKRQLYMALARAIDTLSDTLRTTLILVCVDGRSHEDAAVILGAPEGTIAWRVHEARRKLRAILLERGFELDDALLGSGGAS